ncbi:DUF354 domain-containing protein [Candidatus Bathyarchaeota archaeon]|nr:DUF354 domain-containing protein [Candidatus Bathyarchaeota archaeon]MBS7630941.1 DUF354 domain-containing protein [Candidatus Bathyarchaeota archaeon]
MVDILTPKQCMFFFRLVEHLSKRGHEVHCTTRRYREVNELLRMMKIDAQVVGEHGGGDLSNKLKSSSIRIVQLLELYKDIGPDVSVSFSSPEMARVSFGLRVPHISINDSPHAEAVARLTLPVSAKLLTPFVIPKRKWIVYGISSEKILHYRALDPWMWLKDFKPDDRILKKLGLDESKPVVTFRAEESFASYLLEKSPQQSFIISTINKILQKRDDLQIVVLPRYREQILELSKALRGKALVCSAVVDGPSLLSSSSIFIGGGGTMNAESAILGVPTLSFYPGETTIVERYLIRRKLMKRENNPGSLWIQVLRMLERIREERMEQEKRANELVKEFEDPLEKITEEIESFKR